ncbi:MAG TPA: molybdopterin cofactor-binding domain-containing protein, partial [Anaerolineae bacterium]|nr:molybdopterin cofactor-binding domain-containing protein [Anaerolineae bacterium]
LDAAIEELVVHAGVISVGGDPERSITYAELTGGKKFKRRITLTAPLKNSAEYHIVGQPIPRIDLPRKISGAASFVHDVRLPGMLHARVVRPPSPGAKLISLDEGSVPAVRVVHLNNFIAVVAEREEQAVDAAQQLKVTWRETAHWPKQADLYSFIRRQPTTDEVLVKEGAITAAFKRAARHLMATYAQPFQAHASIGPACAVADVQADRAVIWSNSQGIFPLRGALAELLKMSPNQVQVIHVEGAGSYGHNGSDDAAADAVILSQAVGKPVRVQWSRQDEFRWEPYAPAMVMEVSGGLDRQGRIIAWKYEVWTPSHMGRPRGKSQLLAGQLIYGQRSSRPQWFGGGDRNAPTNYHFANQRIVAHWLAGLPLRPSSMRSLGGAANTFANESFMDELAFAAQIDPLEFRLR